MTFQFPFIFWHMLHLIYSIHTWAAISLEHLANTSVMDLSSDQTEPLPSPLPHESFLFVLAHPVSCCLSHRFMFHTCTLPCQKDSLTLGYKLTIWLYDTSHIQQSYISTSHLYHYSFPSSYFLYTFGQAGWPQSFLSGTHRALNLDR